MTPDKAGPNIWLVSMITVWGLASAHAQTPASSATPSTTIPAGAAIRIVFESEPVVMERVSNALRSTGAGAKQFKARAMMSLVVAPPQAGLGGRLIQSDWMVFSF
jgi:hypothetical protein